MSMRLKVFVVLILAAMMILSSCKLLGKKSGKDGDASSKMSDSVSCPYNSLRVIGSTDMFVDFTVHKPEFNSQDVVSKVYKLMQPNNWSKISDIEKTNQGMSLQFNKTTDKDDYCYEIYANGEIYYHHNIAGAKATRISNGEYVTGNYAFYQAPNRIYNDLVNYLSPQCN